MKRYNYLTFLLLILSCSRKPVIETITITNISPKIFHPDTPLNIYGKEFYYNLPATIEGSFSIYQPLFEETKITIKWEGEVVSSNKIITTFPEVIWSKIKGGHATICGTIRVFFNSDNINSWLIQSSNKKGGCFELIKKEEELSPKLLESLINESNWLQKKLGIRLVETENGVQIADIKLDSEGYKAGLRKGDIILSINNVSILSQYDFSIPKEKVKIEKKDSHGKISTCELKLKLSNGETLKANYIKILYGVVFMFTSILSILGFNYRVVYITISSIKLIKTFSLSFLILLILYGLHYIIPISFFWLFLGILLSFNTIFYITKKASLEEVLDGLSKYLPFFFLLLFGIWRVTNLFDSPLNNVWFIVYNPFVLTLALNHFLTIRNNSEALDSKFCGLFQIAYIQVGEAIFILGKLPIFEEIPIVDLLFKLLIISVIFSIIQLKINKSILFFLNTSLILLSILYYMLQDGIIDDPSLLFYAMIYLLFIASISLIVKNYLFLKKRKDLNRVPKNSN